MMSAKERFRRFYLVHKGCWHWIGSPNFEGRPRFWAGGKHWIAARYSWVCYKGKIPKGLYVCHTCDNGLCVNPAHLFLGTQRDNINDASLKGHMRGRPKLTRQQVAEIKELYGTGTWTQAGLGRKFGVGQANISMLLTGKSW